MHEAGAITGYFDVAQVTLYGFWIAFAGIVYYCHRENKREGYPLLPSANDRKRRRGEIVGFPPIPPEKQWVLTHGAPTERQPERPIAAVPTGNWPGAPLTPTGNPMIDGVGPAAWVQRVDHPDLCFDDHGPKIVPLRAATDFFLATEDPDPRGMTLVGGDNRVAGRVIEAWIDRSEVVLRYLEAEVTGRDGLPRRALIPMPLVTIRTGIRPQVRVQSINADQFADVPALRNPDTVSLLEEDKIVGYYGGGTLYATPARLGPLL